MTASSEYKIKTNDLRKTSLFSIRGISDNKRIRNMLKKHGMSDREANVQMILQKFSNHIKEENKNE